MDEQLFGQNLKVLHQKNNNTYNLWYVGRGTHAWYNYISYIVSTWPFPLPSWKWNKNWAIKWPMIVRSGKGNGPNWRHHPCLPRNCDLLLVEIFLVVFSRACLKVQYPICIQFCEGCLKVQYLICGDLILLKGCLNCCDPILPKQFAHEVRRHIHMSHAKFWDEVAGPGQGPCKSCAHF